MSVTAGGRGEKEVIKRKMNDRDKLMYLAGIMDGEGNMGVYPERSGIHRLEFTVNNTSEELIDWLKENFGGKKTMSKRKNNNKDIFKWYIRGKREIYTLAKQLQPHLIIKREICKVVTDAYEDTFRWGYSRGNNKIPEYALRKREHYYQETLRLNKRGKSGSSESGCD